jgi:TonB family protein
MEKQTKSIQIKVESSDGIKQYNLDIQNKFSIGFKPNNTLQLFGDQVPAKFVLIRSSKDGYVLKIQETMSGEVMVDSSSLSFTDLIKHQLLPWEKDGYLLDLTENKQAKIQFNHVRFHVHFAETDSSHTIKIAYWKLGRRLYRRLCSDLLFKAILVVLFMLGGFLGYKIHLMRPVEARMVNVDKITRHVARLTIKSTDRTIQNLERNMGIAENSEAEPSQPEDRPTERNETPPSNEPSNAPAKTTVLNKGLLGLIAGEGQSNKESAVIETLVDRGLVRELDEILKSGQNLDIELPSMNDIGGNLDNLLTSTEIEVDNLVSGMEIDDGVDLQEKAEVTLESFTGIYGNEAARGWRSHQSIREDLNNNLGRVTFLYKKYLKSFPDLSGKVVVDIVINASGKVANCSLIESETTIKNDQFINELIRMVKTFRFKSIPEGQVTIQNPFVFYRTDT